MLPTRSVRVSKRLFSNAELSRRAFSNIKENFYNEEQKEIQRSVGRIIAEEINPNVDAWEAAGDYPAHQVLKKLGDAGMLGINKPTEYGGMGLGYRHNAAFLEMLGEINCGGVPMSVSVHTDMATPALTRFGTEELKKEFLEPAIKGEALSAIAVSEPGGGSDVAAVKTTALESGDDLVINGSKMWITNAFQADWYCLLANTEKDQKNPYKSKSLICVPTDAKGITLSKRIDKMGMRCSDTGLIHFEDVKIPKKNIIGERGAGFLYQMLQFQDERLAGAAIALGPLDKMIRETIEYTKQRNAFGKPLIENQYIHFRLAELQTEVEFLRCSFYQAIEAVERGEDITLLASMLKLKSGRLCREVSDQCLQYWGGMGFTNEVKVSRFFRDLRLVSIGGGSDETMLSIICKLMGTLK